MKVFLLIGMVLCGTVLKSFPSEPELSVTVVSDPRFNVIGAPVVATLLITNTTTNAVSIFMNDIDLPDFQAWSDDSPAVEGPEAPPAERSIEQWPTTIDAGGVKTVSIPINHYVFFWRAGKHEVKYSLELSSIQESHGKRVWWHFKTNGTFSVELVDADSAVVEEKFAVLADALAQSKGVEQAVLARLICSVHSALAVKYIQKIWETDRITPVNINCKLLAIPALAQIATTESKAFLKAIVLSDPSTAATGLQHLGEQRIILTPEEMRPLFNARGSGIKYAALEYIGRIGGLEYGSAVEALTFDPNSAIAAKAVSVKKNLKR